MVKGDFVQTLQERVAQVIRECAEEHEVEWSRSQDRPVAEFNDQISDLPGKIKQQQLVYASAVEVIDEDMDTRQSDLQLLSDKDASEELLIESGLAIGGSQGNETMHPKESHSMLFTLQQGDTLTIRPEYLEAQQYHAQSRTNAAGDRYSLMIDETQRAKSRKGGEKAMKRKQVPLRPDSSFHLMFEMMSLAVIIHDSIMVPLALSWDLTGELIIHVLMLVSLSVWTLDMFVNFFTGYCKSDGTVEMDRYRVWSHYIRTWFGMDVTIIAAEWTAIILEIVQTSDSSDERSLVRLTKIGKLSRFLHVLVITRLLRVSPNFSRGIGLSATWSIVPQIMKILASIVYINHVNGCVWYMIGRGGYDDTDAEEAGRSWLNQMVTDEGPSYANAGFWFQYFTSVHWSITQMTPGSMEVSPKNSYERAWNIICLLFGLIFGSTLVGQLSSKMVQFNMSRSKELRRMEVLRKFLHENSVDIVLSSRVQQHAQQRLLGKVRLMEEDVEDLRHLPSELRGQLQTSIYAQYFMRHPLFCMWNMIDAAMCHATCASGCLRLRAVLPGHDLFSPQTTAQEASLLLSGNMRYHRLLCDDELLTGNHGKGDKAIKELAVSGNRWLGEVVLWLEWRFVGTLQAESACEFVVVSYDQLIKVVKIHTTVSETAFAWCAAFKQTLATSDMDCEVEIGVPPSTIILSLPDDFRSAISECALAVMGEGLMTRVINGMVPMRTADALETEVKEGACVLAVQATGEFTRTVHVVALKLKSVDNDEKFLVQLAKLDGHHRDGVAGTWEPALQLPGKKVRIGDDRNEAVSQVVADNLPELGSSIVLGRSTMTTEVKESRSYGVPTEYLRTVFEAQLRADSSSAPAHATSLLSLPVNSLLEELEVHVRKCPNGKTLLYAWVTEEEFKQLQKQKIDEMASGWFPDMTRRGLHVEVTPSATLKNVIQKASTDMTIRQHSTTSSHQHSSLHVATGNSRRESNHSMTSDVSLVSRSDGLGEIRRSPSISASQRLNRVVDPPSSPPAVEPPDDADLTFNAEV